MYDSNAVAGKIKFYADQKNISVRQVLINAELGLNTMSAYKTSMPKADNLAKIADVLGCSVDYLLGRTQFPEIQKHDDIRLEKIANIFQNLPDDESKNRLLRVVEAFELSNRYETESRYIGGIAAKGGNAPIIRKGQKKED